MERSKPELSGYVVRSPVAHDATDLGRMHCAVWQQTYADSMDPQAYAALSPDGFAASWSRTLSSTSTPCSASTPEVRTFVAEHIQDGIVGFITVGPARDDDPPVPCQLWALNVAAEHHGTGLAQHLMADVLGDGPAYLWVAHDNIRAITFYERHGFTSDGTELVDERAGITEARMVRNG